MLDMVKVALGGRISEEIFYDSVTTGASDDINKVTQIIQGLVLNYGMTSSIGLVGYGSMGDETYQKPYSDHTNWEIDEEIRRIVKDQYAKTKELLEAKKDLVEQLANRLLEKETINLPDIIDVLGERPYGMNETLQEYLTEMKSRKSEEAAEKADEEAEPKSDDEEEAKKDEESK